MGKKQRRADNSPSGESAERAGHNPFAQLEGLRDSLPEGGAPSEGAAGEPEAAEPEAPGGAAARAVVRYQRKGRGGKEVTRIEKLGLPPAELEDWLKAMKRELGCGGRVEGEALALQGDQRSRAAAWLEGRGVLRVTVS